MSLFNSLKEGAIIENPSQLKQHKDYVKKKNDKKSKEVELRKKMKAELSPEEFSKRYQKNWRAKNKKRKHELYVKRHQREQEERDKLAEEIFNEIEYKGEKEQTIDEYYIEKFREEDTDWEGRYRYSWWASPLAKLKRARVKYYELPVRITGGDFALNHLTRLQQAMQWKIYNFVYPHLDEIPVRSFKMAAKQKVTARPMWELRGRMLELAKESGYPKHQLCEITWAIQHGVYIPEEIYLGHISWIFGEVIVTSMGHMFKIALEHNLPRLTPDTVEEVRQQRINYKRRRDRCPIYLLYNAYLIRVPICKIYEEDGIKDYGHYAYYVVPLGKKFIT